MKPRRVSIALELDTDISIRELKDKTNWLLKGNGVYQVVQVGVNVFQEVKPKKEKK